MKQIDIRTVKIALSVLICLEISKLRKGDLPFFSAIAAIVVIQQDSSLVGFDRIKGTFLGALLGMIHLFVELNLYRSECGLGSNLLVVVFVFFLVHLTKSIKMEKSVFPACVTYLSITVARSIDTSSYLFALNRVFDTMIGVFVAMLINRTIRIK